MSDLFRIKPKNGVPEKILPSSISCLKYQRMMVHNEKYLHAKFGVNPTCSKGARLDRKKAYFFIILDYYYYYYYYYLKIPRNIKERAVAKGKGVQETFADDHATCRPPSNWKEVPFAATPNKESDSDAAQRDF